MTSTKSTVCIDGFNLALPKGSGIATYGRNLLTNLNAIGMDTQVLYGPPAKFTRKRPLLNEVALTDAYTPQDKRLFRTLDPLLSRFGRTARAVVPSAEVIWPARGGGRPAAGAFWTSPRLFNTANRAFKDYKTFTPVDFRPAHGAPRPDVMHWTTILPCKAKGAANVYTVHDLIPLRLPHATLDNKRLFMALCRQLARRADHIAVVSEATRNDFVRLLGVSEDRITTTYQSVSLPPRLTAASDETVAGELAGVFQLNWKGYFLYFGAIEPKKNLGRIVEAYLASGTDMPLVVVGGRAWLEEDELALLVQTRKARKSMKKKIRRYEFLPFSMLVNLIRGARGTLFPSLYEGFGLPVLESMLLGTPVITANVSSLPEVAGDAALMVDPYDVRALAQEIRRLAADDDLAAELAVRGRAQAARFSPEVYQERLREMYGRLGA